MLGKGTLIALVPSAVALVAGAVLPFQAASNAAAGRALGHPLYGALTSLALSAIVIVPALRISGASAPTLGVAFNSPWWIWIGGLLGAVYVGSAATLTPKLGAGGFLICVLAGQMLAAMFVDHFSLMGLTEKPITFYRIAGIVLIMIGVVLFQHGGQSVRASTSTSATSINSQSAG